MEVLRCLLLRWRKGALDEARVNTDEFRGECMGEGKRTDVRIALWVYWAREGLLV